MAKTTNSTPKQEFINRLEEITKFEKQLAKVYQKMAKAAHTIELAQCLSPTATENPLHLKRLDLIRRATKGKPAAGVDIRPITPMKFKMASIQQDLEIAYHALIFQNEKLALYEFLHAVAQGMLLENEAGLIEQTITDYRNTNAWLHQIIQNIIVPGASRDLKQSE